MGRREKLVVLSVDEVGEIVEPAYHLPLTAFVTYPVHPHVRGEYVGQDLGE
jgi:hypothetical protein